MKDEDVETLLRFYRPLGPPLEMRDRVLALQETSRPVGGLWLAAAAALLLATGLRVATHASIARVQRAIEGPTPQSEELEETARWLGLSESERADLARRVRAGRSAVWRPRGVAGGARQGGGS